MQDIEKLLVMPPAMYGLGALRGELTSSQLQKLSGAVFAFEAAHAEVLESIQQDGLGVVAIPTPLLDIISDAFATGRILCRPRNKYTFGSEAVNTFLRRHRYTPLSFEKREITCIDIANEALYGKQARLNWRILAHMYSTP